MARGKETIKVHGAPIAVLPSNHRFLISVLGTSSWCLLDILTDMPNILLIVVAVSIILLCASAVLGDIAEARDSACSKRQEDVGRVSDAHIGSGNEEGCIALQLYYCARVAA